MNVWWTSQNTAALLSFSIWEASRASRQLKAFLMAFFSLSLSHFLTLHLFDLSFRLVPHYPPHHISHLWHLSDWKPNLGNNPSSHLLEGTWRTEREGCVYCVLVSVWCLPQCTGVNVSECKKSLTLMWVYPVEHRVYPYPISPAGRFSGFVYVFKCAGIMYECAEGE